MISEVVLHFVPTERNRQSCGESGVPGATLVVVLVPKALLECGAHLSEADAVFKHERGRGLPYFETVAAKPPAPTFFPDAYEPHEPRVLSPTAALIRVTIAAGTLGFDPRHLRLRAACRSCDVRHGRARDQVSGKKLLVGGACDRDPLVKRRKGSRGT